MRKIVNKGRICQHQCFSCVFKLRLPYFVLFVCFYVFLSLVSCYYFIISCFFGSFLFSNLSMLSRVMFSPFNV